VPFQPFSYRDNFVVIRNPFFYPLTAGFPFFNPWLTVPFNTQAYYDEILCPRTAVNIISLCVGKDQTIRIALQDAFGNWLQPPFDTGRFDISLNGQSVFECSTMPTNYSAKPLPTFRVPFSNPTQVLKFNPMVYIDQTIWAGGILP